MLIFTFTTHTVDLYYIGHGRRNTGDWCFQDDFITFTDLARLYLRHLRGYVFSIVTDCSHSGNWVKECMTFLDQQGVQPCGHSAKDKGILIKVYASCLSHQVPKQLGLSVHGCKNDKNMGLFVMTKSHDFVSLEARMADDQHGYGINFTSIRCGQESIDEECLCLPGANWEKWRAWTRNKTVLNTATNTWQILLIVDDDETILRLLETAQTGPIDCDDYGMILKSGWGQEPTREDKRLSMQSYQVYRDKQLAT